MAKRVRFLYEWFGEELGRVGSLTETRLRAWEYDLASLGEWVSDADGLADTVHLWRTRRPDLVAPELLVGDVELVIDT